MPKHPYHSALASGVYEPGSSMAKWQGNGNFAFARDMSHDGFPPEAEKCDLLYGEPPWPAGYAKFLDRASSTSKVTWRSLMERLGEETLAWVQKDKKRVALMPCSKQGADILRSDQVRTSKLHGDVVSLATWGDTSWLQDGLTNDEILTLAASRFHRVFDPMAGFGNTARVFQKLNRNWVMMDINPGCIGKIAELQRDWS